MAKGNKKSCKHCKYIIGDNYCHYWSKPCKKVTGLVAEYCSQWEEKYCQKGRTKE